MSSYLVKLCGVQGTVEDVLLADLDQGASQLAELRKNNPSILYEQVHTSTTTINFNLQQIICQVTQSTVQGASLLQIFALKGKTGHVTFLLEQG